MVECVMVMPCTERFSFSLPFRIQVFISINAPYEFRSFEERLAPLQPVVTSDLDFFSAAEVSSRAASTLFSAVYGSAVIRCEKEVSKGKRWQTGSRLYPMRVLGGGWM